MLCKKRWGVKPSRLRGEWVALALTRVAVAVMMMMERPKKTTIDAVTMRPGEGYEPTFLHHYGYCHRHRRLGRCRAWDHSAHMGKSVV